MILVGMDIGGTKCAVSLGKLEGSDMRLIARKTFATLGTPTDLIQTFIHTLNDMMKELSFTTLASIGISCGGPLNSKTGIILSPPNLPGWDEIAIVAPIRDFFGVPVGLQNDANACALAEWKWGAGRGCNNMIFLTFGTGMGAGLILDGRLYAGTNDMAGEVGHMRMEKAGPVGYGKAGSFEGFCSGGGIAKLAQNMAWNRLQSGKTVSFCQTHEELAAITAQKVGEAAMQGDKFALEIFNIVGKQLGRGLAVLVDILNPERIVIGSIYGRLQSILEPIVVEELLSESLPYALSVCQIMPAGLKGQVGDYASLSVALHTLE
jgi:glucokinase